MISGIGYLRIFESSTIMEYLYIALKAIIFLGIINVWLFRFSKSTSWRGGQAKSMKEEFAVYGLSENFMYLVGALKVLSASLILISIWYPSLLLYGAGVMTILMIGAIVMHVKVKDPLQKSLPAALMLLMSVILLISI
jgi:FtsH-binding integral membrane protein